MRDRSLAFPPVRSFATPRRFYKGKGKSLGCFPEIAAAKNARRSARCWRASPSDPEVLAGRVRQSWQSAPMLARQKPGWPGRASLWIRKHPWTVLLRFHYRPRRPPCGCGASNRKSHITSGEYTRVRHAIPYRQSSPTTMSDRRSIAMSDPKAESPAGRPGFLAHSASLLWARASPISR